VTPHRLLVRAEDAGKRIDVFLAEHVDGLSRRRARTLIEGGAVWLDDQRLRVLSRRLRAGQEVVCHADTPPAVEPLAPERLLHEDQAMVVIDKPPGVPSHPTRARVRGTALDSTEEYLRRRAGAKVPLWPLHRLDAGTSGILLFAKTREAARGISQNFARRRVRKGYVAVVEGRLDPPEGEIRLPLAERSLETRPDPGGKEAITRYRVVRSSAERSLVEVEPLTGRMHQIRVHLAAVGHPVVGDARYGHAAPGSRLALHAAELELPHPSSGRAFLVRCPPPADFPGLL
jgi:23S rRNA pseudouridine1911/1915/1917 synthase